MSETKKGDQKRERRLRLRYKKDEGVKRADMVKAFRKRKAKRRIETATRKAAR